jgi:YVTN family beta-propeller protein
MRTRSLLSLLIPMAIPACSAAVDSPSERTQSTDEALAMGELLPTGARITPTAAPGSTFEPLVPDLPEAPTFRAGHAVALALSPDGSTLLALTSGYNLLAKADGSDDPAGSNEYVFVYDVTGGPAVKKQVIQVPNTFVGITWSAKGDAFYVSGGVNDSLHVYTRSAAGAWQNTSTIPLGHTTANGLLVKPEAAGVGVTADGKRAVVADLENDAVTIVDLDAGAAVLDLDLRPGKIDPAKAGVAGGEYPFGVAIKGSEKAYVTSERDGEVVVVSLGARPAVTGRIAVGGQPNKLIFDRKQRRLFVANANSDTVSVIDTASDAVLETIPIGAPRAVLHNPGGLKGANPNDLALSPDEQTLYVTEGGMNAVAVVALGEADDDDRSRVVGLIPTGWYPSAVRVSPDGERLYVLNAKSNAGPNPGACRDTLSIAPGSEAACTARNNYVWQLMKAGFLTVPVPGGRQLARLTRQVAANNDFDGSFGHDRADEVVRRLRGRVKHVVYVIKENRTFDQVLGDLGRGDADPSLNLYPEATTPNHHALARSFVTLDRFLDSGETSGNGWNWTTSGRATDLIEKTQPVNYAGRGLSYDWEGTNRNINVGWATVAERQAAMPLTPSDPDLLPGAKDVSSPLAGDDEPEGATAYLWDGALRAGLSLRNYGCFGDLARYSLPSSFPAFIPPDRTPFEHGLTVFFPTKAALQTVSDPYFRSFDMKLPDYWRFQEWSREFDSYVASGELPALSLVRLPHDHTGSFGSALDGVNTPELQTADNDYAVGLLVDRIAKSPFADDTLVFVLEDDAQDGGDHVDAHRSLLLVAGAYVKRGAVVSTSYDTVSVVRTIEDVLGIEHLGLSDALAEPLADVFQDHPEKWTFDAIVPAVLRGTALPLPPATAAELARGIPVSTHDASWWDEQTRGQDFSREDHLDTVRFNEALWRGLKGE